MILFLSCYELGHPPHAIALALGHCERQDIPAAAQDLSIELLDAALVSRSSFIAVSVPMHTALRLALEILPQLKEHAPQARIAFFGLYAALNEEMLLREGVHFVLSGEVEPTLLSLYQSESRGHRSLPIIERVSFVAPSRQRLPPLENYTKLIRDDEALLAGYTEASRGCLHECTHCPIPAVYGGRFFVVPREVVLADIQSQVEQGAQHITFGDPDFLNGPRHAMEIVRALHQRFPGVSFDFTAKVEHLLKHQALLPELVHCGAAFVVSAFESLSDVVLSRLKKGHTRADILRLLPLLEAAHLPVRPTFVPFTPWSTRADITALFDMAAQHSLIENIDPIQYSIRLLLPPGSLLLQEKDLEVGPLDAKGLVYPWRHPDPSLDALAASFQRCIEGSPKSSNQELFDALRSLLGDSRVVQCKPPKKIPPRLTENWFC